MGGERDCGGAAAVIAPAPNPRLLLACTFFALVWLAAAVGTIVVVVHFIVKCW